MSIGSPRLSPARPPIDIDRLSQFLDSLTSYSVDLVQHLHSGQKLCHYTTLEGAIGIIGGGDLWLTHSRFSNDDEELSYGNRVVDEVLDELEREVPPTLPWLPRLRAQLGAARGDHVYICCFCEADNLLSQWRGYAENGGGVSIEFDPAGFTAFTGPDCAFGLMRLWKVFYEPGQQKKIIRDCINYSGRPLESDDDRVRHVVDAIQFFMPTFKKSDFREEQERRLIFTPRVAMNVKPSFRTRRGLLVPYYGLRELSPQSGSGGATLPIKHVTIGPSAHRAMNVESARMILESHGYSGVPVEASTTPYRG